MIQVSNIHFSQTIAAAAALKRSPSVQLPPLRNRDRLSSMTERNLRAPTGKAETQPPGHIMRTSSLTSSPGSFIRSFKKLPSSGYASSIRSFESDLNSISENQTIDIGGSSSPRLRPKASLTSLILGSNQSPQTSMSGVTTIPEVIAEAPKYKPPPRTMSPQKSALRETKESTPSSIASVDSYRPVSEARDSSQRRRTVRVSFSDQGSEADFSTVASPLLQAGSPNSLSSSPLNILQNKIGELSPTPEAKRASSVERKGVANGSSSPAVSLNKKEIGEETVSTNGHKTFKTTSEVRKITVLESAIPQLDLTDSVPESETERRRKENSVDRKKSPDNLEILLATESNIARLNSIKSMNDDEMNGINDDDEVFEDASDVMTDDHGELPSIMEVIASDGLATTEINSEALGLDNSRRPSSVSSCSSDEKHGADEIMNGSYNQAKLRDNVTNGILKSAASADTVTPNVLKKIDETALSTENEEVIPQSTTTDSLNSSPVVSRVSSRIPPRQQSPVLHHPIPRSSMRNNILRHSISLSPTSRFSANVDVGSGSSRARPQEEGSLKSDHKSSSRVAGVRAVPRNPLPQLQTVPQEFNNTSEISSVREMSLSASSFRRSNSHRENGMRNSLRVPNGGFSGMNIGNGATPVSIRTASVSQKGMSAQGGINSHQIPRRELAKNQSKPKVQQTYKSTFQVAQDSLEPCQSQHQVAHKSRVVRKYQPYSLPTDPVGSSAVKPSGVPSQQSGLVNSSSSNDRLMRSNSASSFERETYQKDENMGFKRFSVREDNFDAITSANTARNQRLVAAGEPTLTQQSRFDNDSDDEFEERFNLGRGVGSRFADSSDDESLKTNTATSSNTAFQSAVSTPRNVLTTPVALSPMSVQYSSKEHTPVETQYQSFRSSRKATPSFKSLSRRQSSASSAALENAVPVLQSYRSDLAEELFYSAENLSVTNEDIPRKVSQYQAHKLEKLQKKNDNARIRQNIEIDRSNSMQNPGVFATEKRYGYDPAMTLPPITPKKKKRFKPLRKFFGLDV